MTKGTKTKSSSVGLQDQADRDAAIFERERDVIVLAGAGSGKTSLLTSRFVERVAPASDAIEPTKIERLAAVTFTRKAAGELKNRIRMEILTLLESGASEVRKARAREALSQLDFALIGTIHSFADRLLRLRPIEARISPAYNIIEDSEDLVQEVVSRWIEGASTGTFRDQWSEPTAAPSPADCDSAALWVRDLQTAGVPRHDLQFEFATQSGIDGIVRSWINQRDRGSPIHVNCPYDPAGTDRALKGLLKSLDSCLRPLTSSQYDPGAQHLASLKPSIEKALESRSFGDKLRWLISVFKEGKFSGEKLAMKAHFSSSKAAGTWGLYKQLIGEPLKDSTNLREDIFAPLERALLAQSAVVQPVILSLYEDVKKRYEVIDQLDLLINLRNVLRDNREVCQTFSGLFDHVFVDEFQDTDPIQAEILLYLCHKKGSLTVIGDPKQSIYRFRRADISIFAETVIKLKARKALETELRVNFRSRPGLIRAFNHVFPNNFGPPPDSSLKAGTPFHAESGWVAYSPLHHPPRALDGSDSPVRFLRLNAKNIARVDTGRPLEARLAARYIAWLLDPKCKLRIRDEASGDSTSLRAIKGKDIAVLCRAMTNVHLLADELRSLGVPTHVTGGREFASNPLLQRYILVLNAIANREDGPAILALHQPPFSSVTPADAATQAADDATTAEGALQSWLREIRKNRHARPILHTALDLIERSLALRLLGLGLSAEEDLALLYRFANILAETAAEKGWDFDQAARWAREWIEDPPQLNTPATENDQTVRVLTIHQAKGLEFPVVYLFDGFGREGIDRASGFRISADGKEWMLSAGNFEAEFNPGNRSPSLKEREALHVREEQKRLHYVAATRAKDFLILPVPDPAPKSALFGKVWAPLISTAANGDSKEAMAYPTVDAESKSTFLVPFQPRDEWLPLKIAPVSVSIAETPPALSARSAPSTKFATVTGEAHRDSNVLLRDTTNTQAGPANSVNEPAMISLPSGGAVFGTAVHRAIYLVLAGHLSHEDAVARAAFEATEEIDASLLQAHLSNAIGHLERCGYLDGTWTLLCEVPFAMSRTEAGGLNTLMKGIIDLLLVKGSSAVVVDYKTDASLPAEREAQYREQLKIYESAVKTLLPGITEVSSAIVRTTHEGGGTCSS